MAAGPKRAVDVCMCSVDLLRNVCIVMLARVWQPLSLHPDPDSAALLFVLPVLIPPATLSYQVVERPFLALRVPYLRGT